MYEAGRERFTYFVNASRGQLRPTVMGDSIYSEREGNLTSAPMIPFVLRYKNVHRRPYPSTRKVRADTTRRQLRRNV